MQVCLHVPESIRSRAWAMRQFYGRLAEALTAEGAEVEVVTLDPDRLEARVHADSRLHIVYHTRLRHQRGLSAGKDYIE